MEVLQVHREAFDWQFAAQGHRLGAPRGASLLSLISEQPDPNPIESSWLLKSRIRLFFGNCHYEMHTHVHESDVGVHTDIRVYLHI